MTVGSCSSLCCLGVRLSRHLIGSCRVTTKKLDKTRRRPSPLWWGRCGANTACVSPSPYGTYQICDSASSSSSSSRHPHHCSAETLSQTCLQFHPTSSPLCLLLVDTVPKFLPFAPPPHTLTARDDTFSPPPLPACTPPSPFFVF